MNKNNELSFNGASTDWGYDDEVDRSPEMLKALPACRKAWELHGRPRVRRSLVPGQWEAFVLQTPDMMLAVKAAELFTQRDKTLDEASWDKKHIKRLAKEQALGHGLPTKVCAYDRVVGKCRTGNFWSRSVMESRSPQWVTIRYGCATIEEAIDGAQKGWELKDQAGLSDLQCRITRHALSIQGIKDHTPTAVSEWHRQHSETINVVCSYLPRAHDGKMNKMFAVAAVIAPLTLFYEHCTENGQIQRLIKFLEILRDNPKTEKWVHALVVWMEDPTNSKKRCKPERLSRILICCVRKYLEGVHWAKNSRIYEAEWQTKRLSEDDVATSFDNTKVRSVAKALGISKIRAQQVIGYVTGMNLEHDAAILDLQKRVQSQELEFMLRASDAFRKKLPFFSRRAATCFFTVNIAKKQQLLDFTGGIQLDILRDAWRSAYISKERMAYTPQQQVSYDLPWLATRFEAYEKQEQKQSAAESYAQQKWTTAQGIRGNGDQGSPKVALPSRRASVRLTRASN